MSNREQAGLTEMDLSTLVAILSFGSEGATSGQVAGKARFRTMSPRETAARHCIRLVAAGYAKRGGTRMFPKWRITPAGRAALANGDGK